MNGILNKLDIKPFQLLQKVPIVHQTEASECGLACLAMVCGRYGKSIDLLALRQRFHLSLRGSTLAQIKGIAGELGLASRALSVSLEEVGALRVPCILHWGFNHFVVLVGAAKSRFVLHDPARGRRVIGLREMSRFFTGVALELWPSSDFTAETVKARLSMAALLKSVHGVTRSLAKIFLLSLMIEAIGLLMPVGTQLVMDHVIPAGDQGLLGLICLALIFLTLLQAGVSALRAWSSLVMGTLINLQWQAGLFEHLLGLPLEYFERRRLGDIQSRFGSLDVLQSAFTTNLVGAIMKGILTLGALVMMVLYGGWLTWVVLGFTSLYLVLRLTTYGYYRQLSEEGLIRSARASSYFMETLYGIATVKAQAMGERRNANWLNLKIDAINNGVRLAKMDLLFGGLNTLIVTCDQVTILWLGILLVIDNQMSIGMFVAFGSFRGQFSDCLAALTDFSLQLRMMSLHNERLSDIALQEREPDQPDVPRTAPSPPLELLVEDLSYRYDSLSAPIISHLNLRVARGESLAVCGPSGMGKTTLMKLMCGLFKPESGRILADGVDIWQLGVNNYRKMIACVMQDDRLFCGSIRENICGFTEQQDEAWMIACAEASFIHQTIMRLPMGYDTLIGELGEGLSGGQKQRIFIARALYRKPGILFMDEATSALDEESERYVTQAIKQLNITRIIIAHRKSTIASADRAVRLDEKFGVAPLTSPEVISPDSAMTH